MRVYFVWVSSVCRCAKRLHRMKSSKMLFIFSPLGAGWLSTISLPCMPLRAGGRASMRFQRQVRGPYGLDLCLSIYLTIYIFASIYSISISVYILFHGFVFISCLWLGVNIYNNNNWLQHPGNNVLGDVLPAWLICEAVRVPSPL